METSLKEELKFPVIDGQIVVCKPSYRNTTIPTIKGYLWEIHFQFAGPDNRYKDASTIISHNEVPQFISDLQMAYNKMVVLEKQNFSGELTKAVRSYPEPNLEIKCSGGSVRLLVWISNGNWRFSRSLSSENVQSIIEKLEVIHEKGIQMIDTMVMLEE